MIRHVIQNVLQDALPVSNLPAINPIPSDNAASQSITQQNQQSDSLAALVASHQALAAQVRQSAEATKYQTVTSESIAPTDTTPAPQDIVDKIKSAPPADTTLNILRGLT